MQLKPSPFAPKTFPVMPQIAGIDLWVVETGAKYKNRPDVLLAKFVEGSVVASVFTKSSAPGAPVDWSKARLQAGACGGLLVNAGNANVFTGKRGHEDVREMAGFAAGVLGCAADDVYICSTGVIGEPLDLGPIKTALLSNSLQNTKVDWEQAAQAISTTDTYTKGAQAVTEVDGAAVQICGIVKGSGMIAPDMATMLGFIFTDANISQDVLQEMLGELCETSFNAITVDSDTSTSDTVMLTATRQAGHGEIADRNDPRIKPFRQALSEVMLELSHLVIKDGEGAQKFIEITVSGAASDVAAKTIAMSIANSPLVKTAIAGEDANWGRIVMAVGKSGERADRDTLAIWFGDHLLAHKGVRAADYDENLISEYMKNSELSIRVELGIGSGKFTVWTCDLTHGYIDINADYRS